MCGIAGAVWGPRAAEAVRSMLPRLVRRGPDAEGFHEWPGVALGHRRLAILDLSPAGAQPMLAADGQVGIVFNGCIYNFQEIRAELEKCGHRFLSRCDTEILTEGYLEWGIDGLLPRLRGMFAFAIWDNVKQTLFLARDRLGVKPLLYALNSRGIVFASTLQALRAGGTGGAIDPIAVREFLEFGFVTDTRCIVQGVSKLAPGHLLEWRAGSVATRKYWELPAFGSARGISFEDAVQETERLLLDAVRLRLVSDVPLGALLSGGVDSGLICWALTKLKSEVRAFTVGTPGDPSDESGDAATLARQLGIGHEIVEIDSGGGAPLEEMRQAYGEPFASASALGVLRVSRAVRHRATVLLTGDGGDDVFLGYPFFLNAWKAEQFANQVPAGAARAWGLLRPLAGTVPQLRRVRSFLDYALGGIGPYSRVHNRSAWYRQMGLAGPALSGVTGDWEQTEASFDSARRILADVFEFHRRMHFTSEFMPKVDGGTMFSSLEARAPFLDQKLWEFAVTLPPAIHLRGGVLKAVLREIARRRLGPEVAFRRKQGFTIPIEKWLAQQWSDQLETLKHPNELTRGGWMKAEPLAAAVDDARRRGRAPLQLWYLLVLENWLAGETSGG